MTKLTNIRNQSLFTSEIAASFVVFLVALPLCMGIAIASELPPARGLVTGIVGGVIAAISGSPLLVSGPAAGLAVIVAEIVQKNGIDMIGPILLLAGLMQFLAGKFRLGQLFRAMSPAVIYGMLAGIGILILGSQFHVMLDDKPRRHGLENLITIPKDIKEAFFSGDPNVHFIAGLIGVTTILSLVLWNKFKPRSLKLVPGALVGVVTATVISRVFSLPIHYVDLPTSLTEAVHLPRFSNLIQVFQLPVFFQAFVIAFIASTESLLSAVAVDRLHTGTRTNFDRELAAQGFGNMICGLLGVLPMTGVIARSAVNVEAGAKTRLSGILHGLWLFLLVVSAPALLRMIPTASLAAILVFTGYKLIEVEHIRQLKKYGRLPMVIFCSTFIGIVAVDLLTGVLIGVTLTAMTLIYKMSILNIQTFTDDDGQMHIYLQGAATFVRLPKLASALEKVPPGSELYLHLENLAYIDHSCLDLISTWSKQQQKVGTNLIVQWDGLIERNRRPFTSTYKTT
ncbi:SulP family inorganic anion transporter [Aetokthonos hydrillicola Thurmond2011]|jgi:MFS superfamily sulfate permease-like transporter|uniref:SulP family inorganic anion transporter n=1 Tax=Aetokthonos hydrillicola Thurmond2011 TaxID=2712845 RepID=A0AAP5IDZ4_9CYAN|nr:SulP family inorganic anion transporter [Aetokthonos hydrillicola]MBO3460693.1 SulP family inorganic anion transporter [Aetokthonos hydrillicola CCALA 1050]MBW4587690.1 SulP family inorganic anion transporter [Aetokthonos hydrillicola CCALA 1050]MDR9897928.1 SulP family inorganic anion transporter [Aetokthonos hydrillicola Thurmond2011]